MKLASYSTFGRLRLRKWCPDEEFLEDQDSWYQLIREGVRGVSFLRSMELPDETFQIEIDLFDFIQDLRFEILEIVELPPADPKNGVIELTGFIDKELLLRTFVQISLRDEGHNTSQDAVIEFDQWYGKYVD
jgi:hypothetical protein